jgi:hypothetical protein
VAIYVTAFVPIVAVVVALVTVDAAAVIYWCWFRPRPVSPARLTPRAPMRSLGSAVMVAGILLIGTALWLTILGALHEWGQAGAADWNALAMAGFQVDPDRPTAFGLRCLVVAGAVWAVGFGLTRASGEKA